MESGPNGLQDGAIAAELGARLRTLAAEIEAQGLPPHLEALARQLTAALEARLSAAPLPEPEAPPLARG